MSARTAAPASYPDHGDPRGSFRALALPLEGARGSLALFGVTILVALLLGIAAGDANLSQVFAVPSGMFVAGLVLLLPSHVTIGSDAVRIAWMRRVKLVPYEAIEQVGGEGDCLELLLKDGELVTLEIMRSATSLEHATVEARLLRARVRHALDAWTKASHADDAAASLLARGGRSAWAWLQQLRSLAAARYRGAALVPERLWRVFDDPSAEPTARAGAAALLRQSMTCEEIARVRTVAASLARDELRRALGAIAEAATDDDLLAALERCGASDQSTMSP